MHSSNACYQGLTGQFSFRTLTRWGCWAPLLAVWITTDGWSSQQLVARVTLIQDHRVTEEIVARLNPGYWTAAGICEKVSEKIRPSHLNTRHNLFSTALPESCSFQGLMSRWGMRGLEQASMSSEVSVRENGSAGTCVTWLLSQMMRDKETERRCFLWALVNTPSLSHQNLERQAHILEFHFLHHIFNNLILAVAHLSPSLRALNCLASRHDRSGPTRPPGRAGSEMAPTHTSMLWGVPYKSWNLWAKVKLPRISARSSVVLGTERPQNLRQELYPGGGDESEDCRLKME